ncbi:hypothetical protein PsorP6_000738 [Peronosclerospora sorghi]|uniref:Uncharacterized protein n=1 Tax=Peronosclerospora sorghi TaxID=230839 RepID=A0ACC0WSF5_9STRA|nr:hypothetical protein PsorP6_000738 [Peronosclerospora sorghi]
MFVLLALAVSPDNHALSTSVGNKLTEVAMARDTTAHEEGKRSLRVKERTAETLNEDRMEGPSEPVLMDLLSRVGIITREELWKDSLIEDWELDSATLGERKEILDKNKELSGVDEQDQHLLEALKVDPAVAKHYAVWILQYEPIQAEIPEVIDMAMGGAYFQIFKARKDFQS